MISHTTELTELTRQYKDDCANRDHAHTTEINTLRADYNNRIAQLNAWLAAKDRQYADQNKDHTARQVASQRQYEEWQKEISAKNSA